MREVHARQARHAALGRQGRKDAPCRDERAAQNQPTVLSSRVEGRHAFLFSLPFFSFFLSLAGRTRTPRAASMPAQTIPRMGGCRDEICY